MNTTVVMKSLVLFLIVISPAQAAPTQKPSVAPTEEIWSTTNPPTESAVQAVRLKPRYRWPTSPFALKAVRLRYNCFPPWNRDCQTSDSIIFKRSLKKTDILLGPDGQFYSGQSTEPVLG
ncbi:uncharacterized protein LOC144864944 [Branchiostoma floridae x Branchiostoma japonicum]